MSNELEELIEVIQNLSAELTASFRSQQENYKLIKEKLQRLLAENIEASKSVDNLFDIFSKKLDNLEAKADRVFEEEKEAYDLDGDDEDEDEDIKVCYDSTPIKVIEDLQRSNMAGTMYALYGVR